MKSICMTNEYGTKIWRSGDSFHREDGPAIEYVDGFKLWYLNNHLHREDGPAVERANGTKMWFYHDQQIPCKDNEEFLRMIKLIAFL